MKLALALVLVTVASCPKAKPKHEIIAAGHTPCAVTQHGIGYAVQAGVECPPLVAVEDAIEDAVYEARAEREAGHLAGTLVIFTPSVIECAGAPTDGCTFDGQDGQHYILVARLGGRFAWTWVLTHEVKHVLLQYRPGWEHGDPSHLHPWVWDRDRERAERWQ